MVKFCEESAPQITGLRALCQRQIDSLCTYALSFEHISDMLMLLPRGVRILYIFITAILLTLVAGILLYNSLVRNRNLVSEAWAGIDVQLQKRLELVPNLVQTVKGYATHESSVFEEVAHLRSTSETRVGIRAEQETKLSRSLGRLFALTEDYPDLKASEGFQQLHSSLVNIEEDLQYARRYYNGAVRDNNNAVERIPSNIIASLFKFQLAEFFEIELASQRSAPDVDL